MQWHRVLLGGTLALAVTAVQALRLQEGEQQPARESASPTQAPAAGEERQRPPAPAPAGGFTPSEQIGADSAVSFPVDI